MLDLKYSCRGTRTTTVDPSDSLLDVRRALTAPGTPAEKWYEGIEEWRKGQYFFSHITEIIRLATLYKYGGVYLDTDVVVMQELYDLHNVVGTELAGSRGESKARIRLHLMRPTGMMLGAENRLDLASGWDVAGQSGRH
jgi:hypothetical protein